jgi:molybdate-binding protein/DNA-binding XRE family transcriptional regulator
VKNNPTQEIANNLAAIREQRGLSASVLARMVGVSRQTIYAIEGESYIPNTAVGLRLARALAVSVEDLFSLPEPQKPERRSESVTLLPSFGDLQPGQPVQLCDIDGHLVAAPSAPPSWYLPASDAVIAGRSPVRTKAKVQLHEPETDFRNRLLLAGCDPAMAVVARYLQPAGIELVLVHKNSSQSLSLLKRGHVHIAGTHLRDETTGESNLSAIHEMFPADSVAAISFAVWEEGLVVANGNPKHIKSVQDLARKTVTFLNREPGAGSRFILDTHLKRLKLDPKRVRGYHRTAPGHLAAGWEVKRGAADCCMATQAAARVFGLSFIPLETSRYDLVVRKQNLTLPGIQALCDVINRLSFRRELNSIGGYNTAATGARIL